ncbi:MAG TPA: pentapeptide repeat-containing protein [Coleofasciculaceae cyanobacterium]|jgi:uncharacterized protein YjbI with pentapeptide repeats
MNVREILKKYAAGERDFTAANLAEMNLSGVNLSGANLSEVNLSVANLSGASLSGTNLSRARLNVARLSNANLSNANLTQANLNVTNLIRADLRGADLSQARMIRAELIRAELSGANLQEANLSGADLREAALRQAQLSRATLTEANLRGAFLTGAILEGANLNGADLSRADLSGSNFREAELRQTNLSCANLSGTDFSGANLRWADLSGANLRWADLSNAKLSGANLMGADLSNANLINASLVHADLTQARLIKADWIGADLTGAMLTGAKLYAVSRFGLKTEGMICDWVDLSPDGDRSEIFHLSTDDGTKKFFNETRPTVQISVDAPLDLNANLALASTYHQIANLYPAISKAPSIEVGVRRTVLTFHTDSNIDLFTIAYLAILPFNDAAPTHRNIIALVNTLQSQDLESLGLTEQKRIEELMVVLNQAIEEIKAINSLKVAPDLRPPANFFQAPTHTVVTNSSDQALNVYYHRDFGKYLMNQSSLPGRSKNGLKQMPEAALPPVGRVIEFIKAFDYVGLSNST